LGTSNIEIKKAGNTSQIKKSEQNKKRPFTDALFLLLFYCGVDVVPAEVIAARALDRDSMSENQPLSFPRPNTVAAKAPGHEGVPDHLRTPPCMYSFEFS